jgi:hypothetical protein
MIHLIGNLLKQKLNDQSFISCYILINEYIAIWIHSLIGRLHNHYSGLSHLLKVGASLLKMDA